MSIFNKVLASVGIGATKVDTKLERETVVLGEEVRGFFHVIGGNSEQNVGEVYLTLHTSYLRGSESKKSTTTVRIDRFRLNEAFFIRPSEEKNIPFSFTLPFDVPITIGRTNIWITTGLDINNAVDPTDKDYLNVIPNTLMDLVLNEFEDIGFRLRDAACELIPPRLQKRLPFVQKFEFIPILGPFRGKIDELEIIFFPESADKIEIIMQIDRKVRELNGFFADAMERVENRFTVSSEDIPQLKDKLHSKIIKGKR